MSAQTIEGFRLSLEQQHQWRLRQGVSPVTASVVRISPGVEPTVLETAFQELVRRHESLRTRFESLPGMDLPIQVIDESAGPIVQVVDLEAEGMTSEEFIEQEFTRPFNAHRCPLVRVRLASSRNGGTLLVLAADPLVADPHSVDLLLREACCLVSGGDVDEEPLQFIQFSEWQNELLENPEDEEGPRYWAKELELRHDVSSTLPERLPPGGTGWTNVLLPRELTSEVVSSAERLGAAPRFFLLALWSVLLHRLVGDEACVVDVLSRCRKFDELEGVVGPFARYLPLRIKPMMHRSLARSTKRIAQAVQEHESWEEYFLAPADGAGFGFDFHEGQAVCHVGDLRLERLATRWVPGKFAVRLSVTWTPEHLDLQLHYDPKRLSSEDADRWLERYEALLQQAVESPDRPVGDLDILGRSDQVLLESLHETGRFEAGTKSMSSRFREHVASTPNALAMQAPGSSWSFQELGDRVRGLARRLTAEGLRRGGSLLVALERSAWQLVSPWSAMEVGAAFVPVDPLQPPDRLVSMLKDLAGPGTLLLADTSVAEGLSDSPVPVVVLEEIVADLTMESTGGSGGPVPADSVAYTIFTSGSTGRPKGASIRHRSVTNLLAALERVVYAGAEEDDAPLRVGVNAPLTFDASVKQWGQWVHGRTLVPVPEDVRLDGEVFLSWLMEARLDVLDITPSQLELLLGAGFLEPDFAGRPGRLLVGGEALGEVLWRRLASVHDMQSFNVYGPTETTVDVTVQLIEGERPVLGRPLANVRVYVVDERDHRVPPGVPGELLVGGAGVALGYVGRAGQTAERFVPDELGGGAGGRLYRTGDRVRMLPDGRLEYLGRLDRQVKLRGIRLEPGEIESVLSEHGSVKEVSVVLREDAPGAQRLVAYVTPRRSSGDVGVGRERGRRLPNGLVLAEQNRNETEYLYEEIFAQRSYARHGIRLPDDAVVLDVGANIGMYTLFVHQECVRPQVYAFEPIDDIYRTLETNVSAYGGFGGEVKLFPHGLSDAERTERFTYYPGYSMMSGQAAYARPESEVEVVKRFLENQRAEGVEGAEALLAEAEDLLEDRFAGREVEVRLRRLSDVMAEESIAHVDLLKVDVQRAERDVLEGLSAADWDRIDQVVMEVHDAVGEASEGRAEELRGYLESQGFRVVVEQDELLVGTDRYNLYAVREGLEEAERSGEPSALSRALEASRESKITPESLREHVGSRLPDYMVPSSFVVLERLPLTRHGKVDREALPAPEEVAAAADREVTAPRTPVEEVLASVFGEVLGVERFGVEESFFDLGGHSLLATQLVSRVREAFQVELPLRALFEAPSVEQLAGRVEREMAADIGLDIPPIETVEHDGELPLSFAQQRLWFMHQVEPQSAAYNLPAVLRLQGFWVNELLNQVMSSVLQRHEVFRTRFENGPDGPMQRIDPAPKIVAPVVDLRDLEASDRESELRHLASREARRPFDLKQGPMLRIRLVRLQEDDHAVLETMHHIVSDGWSMGILVREIEQIYRDYSVGCPSSLTELKVQYADFAQWQRQCLDTGLWEPHLDYWRRQLGGAPERLALPRAERGPRKDRFWGASHAFQVESEVAGKIRALGRQESVTLFMTLLAGFYALLQRWSGQDDLVVGTDIAGRNRVETEPLIGFFINHLVLRADVSNSPTFRELLVQTREITLDAYAHQDLPFDLLVRHLKPKRELSRTPLFDVLFVLQNNRRFELDLPNLERSAVEVELSTSKFDLALFLREAEGQIAGSFKYNPELFEAGTIDRMAEHFEKILRRVAEDPDIPINQLEVVNKMEKTERRQSKLRNLKRASGRSRGRDRGGPVEIRALDEDKGLPLMFRPKLQDMDLTGWAQTNEELVTEKLLQHGALLFRGFGLGSVSDFEGFARAASRELYGDYGDLPREQEGEQVYESTPYPADKTILFHNESSHMHCWPLRQFFYCAQPSAEGGETPLVDCREIYRRLPASLRETFESKELIYVRNFVEGLDVTWRDFFHTDDKDEVERVCRKAGIECHWKGDVLETRKQARAVARHPKTGDVVFFNQIQLHHPACLDPEVRESMLSIFGEENFPRNVLFGDGTPIEDSIVEDLLALYWDCAAAFPWQQGDVVMVDNMLCAHARNPYAGERKIVVAMGDMFHDEALAE